MPSEVASTFHLLSLTLVTAAGLAWLNAKLTPLPTTIGVMIIALAMSIGLQGMSLLGLPIEELVTHQLERIDFRGALLDVMLAFLLFAGALHVKSSDLLENKWIITLLATVGVILTTAMIGLSIWQIAPWLGISIGLMPCLLFGALISPTDPIAVLGILRSSGVPKRLQAKIAGESLFNDGIGVVVFSVLLSLAAGGPGHGEDGMTVGWVLGFLGLEILGAFVMGFACGALVFWLMRGIEDPKVEVLLSLALAMGTYSAASALHMSGPLAVVVAGLFVGNPIRVHAFSEAAAHHVDTFWELVDEILNIVLFVLIGMEVLLISFTTASLTAGLVAIPVVLLARFIAVGGSVTLLRLRRHFTPHSVKIMTWCGLRGGISVALALSLPADFGGRELIVTMTYVVVIFSIIVQGLTITPLIDNLAGVFDDRE
jgi:CPA1 family monovalent cation:H+ antiporter